MVFERPGVLPEVPECLPRGPWDDTLATLDPRGALEGSRVRIWSSFGTLRGAFLAHFRSLRELWSSNFVIKNSLYTSKGVSDAKLYKILTALPKTDNLGDRSL